MTAIKAIITVFDIILALGIFACGGGKHESTNGFMYCVVMVFAINAILIWN